MRKTVIGLALGLQLLWTTQSRAKIGTLDNVPAATLLVPYFEVDLDDPNGVTTFLSINNASAQAMLAHVTLWTDRSVPTFGFDVYLTGYDIEGFDLRSVFNGILPQTASPGQDPTGQISPQGAISQDLNFPSCTQADVNDTSYLPHAPLSAADVASLRAAHTGKASVKFGGQCSGTDFQDNLARGYITVDSVDKCGGDSKFPTAADYFLPSPNGYANGYNALWGETMFLHPQAGTADGEAMVAIEADANDPLSSTDGSYTFYGRYVGEHATDHREPLATAWLSNYLNARTDLIVWRDSGKAGVPFTCGSVQPALSQGDLVAFDWEEDPVLFNPALKPFPAEANRVTMGGSSQLPVPFKLGWLYLDLNATTGGAFDPIKQSYVTAVHRMDPGVYSSEIGAVALDNASNPASGLSPCKPQSYLQDAGTAPIDPGTVDGGNHGDNVMTSIALPFPVLLDGMSFSSAKASTNGNLQFSTTNPDPNDVCLPAPGFDRAIFAFWDDLTTTAQGDGIFTSVSGSAPNRFFNIEWRAHVKDTGKAVNFEIRFPESGFNEFEIIYSPNIEFGATNGVAVGYQKSDLVGQIYTCTNSSVYFSGRKLAQPRC